MSINDGVGNFDPSFDIDRLAKRADETLKDAQPRIGSLNGRLSIWLSHVRGKIPKWAREHIMATREFTFAINRAKRNGINLSEHTIKLLKACRTEMHKLCSRVNYSEYLDIALAREPNLNPEGLLLEGAQIPIFKEMFEWQMNAGLFMNVYNQTQDLALKKQISFLIIQYLAKAAPLEDTYLGIEAPPPEMHLGFFVGRTYHREFSIFEPYLDPILQKHFPSHSHEALFLLDTKACQDLLPLFYSVITSPKAEESTEIAWAQKIASAMSDYLLQGDFSTLLETLLVFDFTDEREKTGEQTVEWEQRIEKAIALAAINLRHAYPTLKFSTSEIKGLIRANIICLSRHEVNGTAFIRILPLFNQPKHFRELKGLGDLKNFCLDLKKTRINDVRKFLNRTGIRLGAVHGREALFNHIDLDTLLNKAQFAQYVEYYPIGENILYFERKSALTDSALFKRFTRSLKHFDNLNFGLSSSDSEEFKRRSWDFWAEANGQRPFARTKSTRDTSKFPEDEEVKPEVQVDRHQEVSILGTATVHLFTGLLEEISEENWELLNQNPEQRMLIQTTLFRFMQHLARAENTMHLVDISPEARGAFVHSMELAQTEISTLLTLFTPFQEEEFANIYQKQLSHIPENLREYMHVGVGKSAMNVFAGINMLVAQTTKGRKPERVISEDTYYEEVDVVGNNRTLKDVMGNQVDLYIGEFNHNIKLDRHVHHYEAVDIVSEVDTLLSTYPETERLTVAIDETIDYVQSAQVTALLEHFSEAITEGRLNVVIFRSGQKFDMLGMDHYYGAPFYMINNGDTHWKTFDRLLTDPLFKTDPLSMQWFCLANKYGFQDMEAYRERIFYNTRTVLDQVPERLKEGQNPLICVSTADEDMQASFIDIKFLDPSKKPDAIDVAMLLTEEFYQNKQTIHVRSSFGFPHTNLTLLNDLEGKPCAIRINVGLDPADVQLISKFFKELSYTLNS